MKKIKIIELFAGVGGFRLGLESASAKELKYEVAWSSQWEPGATTQHASDIYIHKFGPNNHSCEDIQEVVKNKFKDIPDHDLLVGGFPCQDYSVARTLKQAEGLNGKKGVLWWSIHSILEKKGLKKAPKFLMLENVDRLLKSPASQRGRDFAVMLASLSDLGYAVEWRVINAAEYGFPQRRRRVYIMGYKKGTELYNKIRKEKDKSNWILKEGVIANAFSVENTRENFAEYLIEGELPQVSEKFSAAKPAKSPFENSGVMLDRKFVTMKVFPKFKGKNIVLKDIIVSDETRVPKEFFIDEKKDLKKWEELKGAKKEKRTSKSGFEYDYSEGAMTFPDSLDKASRTIVTGEGGSSASRFKHVIKTKSGRLRRLMPSELEKLNMFPSDHTKFMFDKVHGKKEVPDIKRAFIMGNALVVGVIRGLGESLRKFAENE